MSRRWDNPGFNPSEWEATYNSYKLKFADIEEQLSQMRELNNQLRMIVEETTTVADLAQMRIEINELFRRMQDTASAQIYALQHQTADSIAQVHEEGQRAVSIVVDRARDAQLAAQAAAQSAARAFHTTPEGYEDVVATTHKNDVLLTSSYDYLARPNLLAEQEPVMHMAVQITATGFNTNSRNYDSVVLDVVPGETYTITKRASAVFRVAAVSTRIDIVSGFVPPYYKITDLATAMTVTIPTSCSVLVIQYYDQAQDWSSDSEVYDSMRVCAGLTTASGLSNVQLTLRDKILTELTIHGRSAVQIADISKAEIDARYATFTQAEDGTCAVTRNAGTSADVFFKVPLNIIPNHKYLCRDVILTSIQEEDTLIRVWLPRSNTYEQVYAVPNAIRDHIFTGSLAGNRFFALSRPDTVDTEVTIYTRIEMYDLTAMGIEDITVDEFNAVFNRYIPLGTDKDISNYSLDERVSALEDDAGAYEVVQDLEAANYLGWGTPAELIEQGLYNYVSSDVCHKRVGRVKADELNWAYDGNNTFYTTSITATNKGSANIFLDGYNVFKGSFTNAPNMSIQSGATNKFIFAKNTAYTDATAFKSSLQDKYLYYELATEQTAAAQISDELAKLPAIRSMTDSNYHAILALETAKNNLEYSVEELTFGNCTLNDGGVYTYGAMAHVNMLVTCTADGTIEIAGLPRYTNFLTGTMAFVQVTATRFSTNSGDLVGGYIDALGNLAIHGLVAGKKYILAAHYLWDYNLPGSGDIDVPPGGA